MRASRVVLHTSFADPFRQWVGAGPILGGYSGVGFPIPRDPTPDQMHRYLIRLLGIGLGPGSRAVIRSLRQLLTIGTTPLVEENGPAWLLELPVRDPSWSFVDGNVSWHLRRVRLKAPDRQSPVDGLPTFGYSARADGLGPVILAQTVPPSVGGGGYTPVNSGVPFGHDIGGLGTWYDMRYPWDSEAEDDLGLEVVGPCDLVLYASVHQTDPEARPNPPVVPEGNWIRPEDEFVIRWPEARYWRIGARMIVDLYTPEDQPRRAGPAVPQKNVPCSERFDDGEPATRQEKVK